MRCAGASAVVVSCGLWSVVCPRRVCPYSAVCCGNEIANRAASFFSPCWAVYGNTGFAGDSCRLGEESGVQTHVHRFRTPQSVCSAASIFTTCSKEFGALGAAVVRCPGCALQVE